VQRYAFVSLVLCSLTGCADKAYQEVPVYPVEGRLTVAGAPAQGAYVAFHPTGDVGMTKGNKPFARVDREGNFRLTTYEQEDGAPAGNYRVSVFWPENPEARGPSPDRLEGRYSESKSPLTVTIEPAPNALPAWDLQ